MVLCIFIKKNGLLIHSIHFIVVDHEILAIKEKMVVKFYQMYLFMYFSIVHSVESIKIGLKVNYCLRYNPATMNMVSPFRYAFLHCGPN